MPLAHPRPRTPGPGQGVAVRPPSYLAKPDRVRRVAPGWGIYRPYPMPPSPARSSSAPQTPADVCAYAYIRAYSFAMRRNGLLAANNCKHQFMRICSIRTESGAWVRPSGAVCSESGRAFCEGGGLLPPVFARQNAKATCHMLEGKGAPLARYRKQS